MTHGFESGQAHRGAPPPGTPPQAQASLQGSPFLRHEQRNVEQHLPSASGLQLHPSFGGRAVVVRVPPICTRVADMSGLEEVKMSPCAQRDASATQGSRSRSFRP